VLVTGGGRGIGRAIALRFAREGGRVAVAARTSAQLDSVVAEIESAGARGLAAQVDVCDPGSIEAALWRVDEFMGGALELLVNNAGVFDVTPFERLDYGRWRALHAVNLDGAFLVTKGCLDALKASGRGHVINVASQAARRGYAGNVAYCASKYGLRGFSDALREDLRPLGIRVTTLYPGPTDTAIFDRVPGEWDRSRMKRPEEVAEVAWSAWSSPAGVLADDLDA
jgi:NAD(P)-dependent dehydrogenase (short-subunit alcohol dehydrogenase family)